MVAETVVRKLTSCNRERFTRIVLIDGDAYCFHGRLHKSVFQALEEYIRVSCMNVSREHPADTLNGAFAGSPVVFRFLPLCH